MEAFSKIVSVEKEDDISGIVFDSIEEVEHALEIFGKGLEGSDANEWHQEDVKRSGDQAEVTRQIFRSDLIAGAKENVRLGISKLLSDLNTKKEAQISFDHNAGETPFYKTHIDARYTDGSYLLVIRSAGADREQVLAEKLGKSRGLASARVVMPLQPLEDGSYRIDVNSLLRPFRSISFEGPDYLRQEFLQLIIENRSIHQEFTWDGKSYFLSAALNTFSFRSDASGNLMGRNEFPVDRWDTERGALVTEEKPFPVHFSIKISPSILSLRDNSSWRKRLGKTVEELPDDMVPEMRTYSLVLPEDMQQLRVVRDQIAQLFGAPSV